MRERHVDDLLDAAGLRGHHHGAVAEQQRFLDRMGDVDHGLAGLLPDPHQLGLQDDPVLGIERGQRLVHQQHAGIGDEGARDRAALAHAAGKLMRIVSAEFRQSHEFQGGVDPRRHLGRRHPARHQAEADIGLHAHPGKQAALLEHHRVLDRPARGLDLDGAAGLFRQPREDPQQRRLPAARRTDDADELARRDVQIDVVERHHAALAAHELLAQSDDVDRRPAPLNGHSNFPRASVLAVGRVSAALRRFPVSEQQRFGPRRHGRHLARVAGLRAESKLQQDGSAFAHPGAACFNGSRRACCPCSRARTARACSRQNRT